MPYSSSLTDNEWEIIAPLLPQKKRTRPPRWTKREILDGIFYQLKNGCNWGDLPKDLPPYSTVFWHYKHWRAEGVLEQIRDTLHAQVREQVKKNHSGQPYCWLIHKRWETPVTRASSRKGFVSTNAPMASNDIWRSIPWDFPFSRTALKPTSAMTRG